MRRFLPLLLCLSLSIFTAARAVKQIHALGPDTKSNRKPPIRQEADARTLLKHANTEQETGSSDNGNKDDDASNDDGEDVNGEDGGDAGADDDGGDDNGADENEGDDGGDDGGE